MIRLIQRRLIVPRGDTGTFSIPVLAGKDNGDVSIFTIFDTLTHRKIFEKVMQISDGVLSMDLTHGDTVNLPVGQYVWDIKFYSDPVFADEKLVGGIEVDSYYSAFNLPICEIRETGDNLLMADDAPTSKLAPDQINYVEAALVEVQSNASAAANSAANADTSATNAETSAAAALVSEQAALTSETNALASEQAALASATAAAASASEAAASAAQIEADLETKVNIADLDDVAFSGDYEDLVNVPTDLSEFTNGPGYLTQHQDISGKANIIDLAAVATSGEYSDLSHTPTNVSAFTNDAGYLTQHQDISMKANSADLATVATSGSYNDLSNKPFIPSAVSDLTDDSGHYTKPVGGIPAEDLAETYLTQHQDISMKANSADLAAVATSGAYSDLSGVPTNVSSFINDAGYLTQHQDISNKADKSEIPTLVSELQNDSGYITGYTETDPTVPSWAKAAQKPTYTAAEVGAPTTQEMNSAIATAIGNVHQFDIQIVQSLPTQDIQEHTVYFIPKTGETNDVYDEYIYVNNGWEMIGNTQIDLSNYVQKDQIATASTAGLVKVDGAYGIIINPRDGTIAPSGATDTDIKAGASPYRSIMPIKQHQSVFYGLAKAAGDTTQSQSDNAVGTYTTEAKAAIRSMLGAAASSDIPNVPVQDVQINNVSILSNGIANIPTATNNTLGVVKINGNGLTIINDTIRIVPASDIQIKEGSNTSSPLSPIKQHQAVFYGLAKAAGDNTQAVSDNAVGTYTDDAKSAIRTMLGVAASSDIPSIPVQDVQINEMSILNNGIANIPIATDNNLGLVYANGSGGIGINPANGLLFMYYANSNQIKAGTDNYKNIVAGNQHKAVFYGLAKAAGDSTQSVSENAIGTYTSDAKSAIQNMLGITAELATKLDAAEAGMRVVRLI